MIFGRYIFIFNDTDDKVKNLCFYYPISNTVSKVKACRAYGHVTEMIADTVYQGDVTFFFDEEAYTEFANANKQYTFTFPNTEHPGDVAAAKQDHFNMYLKIVIENGKHVLKEDHDRDYYSD